MVAKKPNRGRRRKEESERLRGERSDQVNAS